MRLSFEGTLRRFIGFALLIFCAGPVGLSIAGCHKAEAVTYCNAGDNGPAVGAVSQIVLSPSLATTGESVNYGQIGSALSASAQDCKGNAVSVRSYTYATTNMALADVNPANGEVCGGTWNRNTGGGIQDYTICTAPVNPPAPTQPITLNLPSPTLLTLNPAASTFTYTATQLGTLFVSGGSVSAITVTNNGTTTPAGVTSGALPLAANESVTITYSAAPTVTFTPNFVYTASTSGTIQIIGGTVDTVVDNSAGVITNEPTSGIVSVQGGDSITVTYTGVPTVIFTPAGLTAFITATASGATSNPIAVYVHPIVTSVLLGGATSSCTTDPGSDCCPGITTTGTPINAPVYTGSGCLSQASQGQLIGRVYANGRVDAADNITCQVGHLTFLPQGSTNIVTIDTTGVATANQPGSATITAQVANSTTGSSAGFFSTCPPTNITLSVPGQPGSSFNDAINNLLPITAVVTDKNGKQLTGLNLEFNSTTPQTIPATTGSVTPTYPGTATITAVCLPGSCNPAPFSQIGLYGNGQPLTSNGITVTATGTSSTVLYMASTQSQYVQPQDFTTGQTSAQIKLPYAPNSMVITQNGSTLFFGSSFGLMTITTASNAASAANQNVTGVVLAASPDGNTVVVTDPVRQTVGLYTATSGALTAVTQGIGTRAQWSPDSQTVYVTTTTGTLLTHSNFTGWQSTALTGIDTTYSDVAVTVPSVGAYFAGGTGGAYTEGRSYCPSGTLTGTGTPQSVNNTFAPLSDEDSATTDRLAATTDGNHILGAHANGSASTLSDIAVSSTSLKVSSPCPQAAVTAPISQTYFSSTHTTLNLTGINVTGTTAAPPLNTAPTGITGVVPASNSALAFVTYLGTSGLLPLYVPSTQSLTFLRLGNGATTNTSPVTGVFSTDNLTFFAGTQGASGAPADNNVHQFSITGTAATETGVITPNLPCYTVSAACPNVAPINLLAQKVKRATS